MVGAMVVLAGMLCGPGSGEPPIEGPARPPAIELAPQEPQQPPAVNESGIEFAVEPPDEDLESDPGEAAAIAAEPYWPDPGSAPSDGMGLVVSGAVLVPSAALFAWQLYLQAPDKQQRVAVLATGVSMEVMAAIFIATGLYRRAKLHRWTTAYRVVARPQGAGMLSAAGIALGFGASLAGTGIALLAKDSTNVAVGATLLGVGVAGVVGIAPPLVVFGKRRREAYLATGGWYRPPMPTVELAPRLIVGREMIGLGVAGRF